MGDFDKTVDWQPMHTAPKDGRDIRVQLEDGSVVEKAHWACDLSGEEQPAFRGWFKPVRLSDGSIVRYIQIEPVAWAPVEKV